MSQPLLELKSVTKVFGANAVVTDVSFSVGRGEVVGLIGDNGAGKSTLVKIITGYTQPTSGEVEFDGSGVKFSSPADARSMGIEAVYQDLGLVGELSLWRNFFIGKELRHGPGWSPLRPLNKAAMKSRSLEAMRGFGLSRILTADRETSELSGGERQSLAITRSTYFGAKMLILDEPAAALSVGETMKVLDTIRATAAKGLGVIYIDHNMSHVRPVADRVVALAHGRVVADISAADTTVDSLNEILTTDYLLD